MTRALLTGLVASIASAACAAPVPKADDPDKLATAAAESLIKALKARDADALVKLCDVPFREGSKTYTDKDELAKFLAKMAKENKVPDLTVSVRAAYTVPKFAEWLEEQKKEKPPAEKMKAVADLVGEGGRVVVLKVEKDGKPDGKSPAVCRRIKDGVAKVVGLID